MAITRHCLTYIFNALLLVSLLAGCVVTPVGPEAPGLIRKAFSPTWGPDGQKIGFLYRYRPEGSQEVKDSLYTILANGTDLVKVRTLSPARFKSANWSPNGAYFLLTKIWNGLLKVIKLPGIHLSLSLSQHLTISAKPWIG